jgi:hypothetical protein
VSHDTKVDRPYFDINNAFMVPDEGHHSSSCTRKDALTMNYVAFYW